MGDNVSAEARLVAIEVLDTKIKNGQAGTKFSPLNRKGG